jgi:hypothetical protein
MLRHLFFLADAAISIPSNTLATEFPTIAVGVTTDRAPTGPTIEVEEWDRDTEQSFASFEERGREAARLGEITISGAEPRRLERVALQVLTRFQRHVDRRNAASSTLEFERILATHADLHASEKPLVVADRDHALDTWQWLMRLAPKATKELQIAALFHDVERLVSEADRRVEHLAPDYQRFKDTHARGSAILTSHVLANLGVESGSIDRVANLLRMHERRADDPDGMRLADADALSFFSLNSSGYMDYFGADQTSRKIRFTLGRLGASRRPLLRTFKLRADVRALLTEVLATDARGNVWEA